MHERIDTVKVDSDEGGWQLVIVTEDGERHLFPLPEGADRQLVREAKELAVYLDHYAREREIARGEYLAGIGPLDALEEVFRRG